MDRQDKEFETYLRQFRLRQPGPMPAMETSPRPHSMRWVLAAAVVVIGIGLAAVALRNSGNAGGPKATIEAAGNPSVYRVGEIIDPGRIVRSNSAQGMILALGDGSRVELRSDSELKLERADDGIRVRLDSGSILVTAAKQDSGHLYVETRDAVVSVVGTVFAVNAEPTGTTVSVVEGAVQVQQGTELKELLPGEQLATNPGRPIRPLAEEIAWSRSAGEYVALLQVPFTESIFRMSEPVGTVRVQSAPPVKPVTEPRGPVEQPMVFPVKIITSPIEVPILTSVPAQAPSTNPGPQGAPRDADPPVPSPAQQNDDDGKNNGKNNGKKEDPDVAGARILGTACTTCHDLGVTTGRTGDRATWDRIVNGMVGYGAQLKDPEIGILIDYLTNRYGPPKQTPAPPQPGPTKVPR